MAFVGSSIWQIRQKIGNDRLVWPGVTLFVRNPEGKILLAQSADSGNWGVLGGLFEVGDDAESCARRELKEETGLEPLAMEMFGIIQSVDATTYSYSNGHEMQAPGFCFAMDVAADAPLVLEKEELSQYGWFELEGIEAHVTSGKMGYSRVGLPAYRRWLETGEFQIV